MQAAMPKRKRHSRVEIATKLAQANDLATQGKLQSEIARTLGVSVMTLHRWRKAPPGRERVAFARVAQGAAWASAACTRAGSARLAAQPARQGCRTSGRKFTVA